jgi:uncharacterized protein YxjI
MSQNPIAVRDPGGAALLAQTHFTVRKPFWQWFSRRFEVDAPDGQVVAFINHPVFKLKEQFTVFADRAQQQPLLFVKVRKLMTLNHCYDVIAVDSGQKLGSIRKRGMKSIVRDTWDILDADDQPVGLLEEEGFALLRRFVPLMIGRHRLELGGQVVARMKQVFRWFTKEFALDLSAAQGRIDPRFAIACCLLALMAEANREQRN